jgi:hypothetical protein
MSAHTTKGKGTASAPMTVAKLRRMGAFKGDASVEERLRMELMTANFSVDFLMPLARTGDKVRKKSEEGNEILKREAEAQHADWQAKAAKLWAQPQHAKKGKSAIARLIEPERWNTARLFISNPKK